MTPVPPCQLRLSSVASFKSSWWWLGLLYRRPKVFDEALARLPRMQQFAVGLVLYLRSLPFQVLVCVLGRLFLFGIPGLEARNSVQLASLEAHAREIALGLAGGAAFGVVGLAGGIAEVIAWGIAGGVAFGVVGFTGGIGTGIAFGIAFGLALGVSFGLAVRVAAGIAGGIVAGLAFGFVVGIAFGIAVGVAVGITLTRAFYWPLHLWFVWPRVRAHWYRRHPVAWDDLCGVPFPGLHRLLVAYAEAQPEAGAREIERLITTYPTQKASALKAKTILTIRRAGATTDLARLDEPLTALPEGDKGYRESREVSM